MSVKKREGSPFWWCYFTIGGERVRESTGTSNKELAEKYEAKRKQEIWEQQRLGRKERKTWPDAVVRWSREKGHKKSIKGDLGIFAWLDPYLRRCCLDEIDEDKIAELIEEKLASEVGNASVNRMLALIRSVLNRGRLVWKWIDHVPLFELLPEKERVRWLTPEAAARLLLELPDHLEVMAEFSLETGLRAANVRGLKWSQIDMQRRTAWVNADESKSGAAIGVPLSARAVEILRGQIGRHLRYVFTYAKGKHHARRPITGKLCTRAWRKALARLGYNDLRWHDLRHTWASWHVQRGTPLHVLKELGGWSDIKMVLRYAHQNVEHLRVHVDAGGTKLTHDDVTEKKGLSKEAASV